MAKATTNATIETQRTVTLAEARCAIKRCFEMKKPVFLWASPGIGKSDLIRQIGLEMGAPTIDLRLAIRQSTDILGIPYYNKDKGLMDWAPPVDLPTKEFASKYPAVILFLDELNSAAPAVQAAAYQLVLDRKVGNYELPDNVVIAAAGNRESDKGVTFRMPTPLANRFVHLEVRCDFDTWVDWAANHNVHPDVIGFLSFAKQHLNAFDPKSSSRAFGTPRSWAFVSDLIGDGNIAESTLHDLVAGTVGDGAAMSFMAHRKVASKLPKPDDILTGKVTTLETKEISAHYSLVVSMCYSLKELAEQKVPEKRFYTAVNNFFSYMMKNFAQELVILGIRLALKNYGLDIKFAHVDPVIKTEFHKTYGKYVLSTINLNER